MKYRHDQGLGRLTAVIGLLVIVAAVGFGVVQLREATMATHQDVAPDSRVEVVIDAHANSGESGQGLTDLARAKVAMCTPETRSSDVVSGVEPVGPTNDGQGRFRFVLQPALDDSDQTQFGGCLRDWNLDHVRVYVRAFNQLPPSAT